MKDFYNKDHKPKSSGPDVDSGSGLQRTNTKSSTKLKKWKYGLNKKSNISTFGTNITETKTGQKFKK